MRIGPRSPIQPGRPYPLGATWTGRGVNFALFSENAEKVELCLFDSSGKKETARLILPERTDDVWHGYIPNLRPGQLYGYRVYGPYDPQSGNRFNANKLLVDPYARAVSGVLNWHPSCYGYRHGHPKADLSFDKRDNARHVPKGVVVKTDYPWGAQQLPETPWHDTVIYETHVRGMTLKNPDIPAQDRGRFLGLSHPAILEHLVGLGVTAVELLPVQSFASEPHLSERGLTNYWGYNPLSFFAPHPAYAQNHGPDEFKAMVERFHDAGIEVILDVVYNHTCEGNHLGPTLSWRGIDNRSYYHLTSEDPRYYHNHSGCGNTLNVAHPRVLQMVMDSLRYWVETMHVDGFRFDLASAVARGPRGFEGSGAFLAALRQDPVLQRAKLIAEPWDLGPQGYRLGGFPTGWREWNDAYRNVVRGYWRGDDGHLGPVATRLSGSSDLFWKRSPLASLNYITSHDGFTLADLVSYNGKHNQDNGENNADGTNYNLSWNCGAEGPSDDPAITRLRRQQRRNLLATLMISQGVPMLLMGDERGRTQQGNNNAYCQDSALSWVDWSPLNDEERHFQDFLRDLIALRRNHPALRRLTFFTGRPKPGDETSGVKDVTWLSPQGWEIRAEEWSVPQNRCLGMHINGAEPGVQDDRLLILLNAHSDPIPFTLPGPAYGHRWSVLLDTARADTPTDEDDEPGRPYGWGEAFPLLGRSLVILADRTSPRSEGYPS